MDPDGHLSAMRVFVSDGRGRRVGAAGLARWLRRIAPARARGLVSIAIVSDAHVQRLNRRFTNTWIHIVGERRELLLDCVIGIPREKRRTPQTHHRIAIGKMRSQPIRNRLRRLLDGDRNA